MSMMPCKDCGLHLDTDDGQEWVGNSPVCEECFATRQEEGAA